MVRVSRGGGDAQDDISLKNARVCVCVCVCVSMTTKSCWSFVVIGFV